MSKKELKVYCEQKRLVTWLNGLNIELSAVKDYLGLNKLSSLIAYKERINIARQYAKILDRYVPEDNGDLNQVFNYFQLVYVVKKVFKNHIRKNYHLFTGGFEVCVEKKKFFAKVESHQIFLFRGNPRFLGEGASGNVGEVYEIGSRQWVAVKWASEEPRAIEYINREKFTLRHIHNLTEFVEYSVEGIQSPPLATFSLTDFVGFIGVKYGVDLMSWSLGAHSNEERISICKSIVKAFSEKCELGYWHGDIKPENILLNEEGVVLIDWAGSIPFHEGEQYFITPYTETAVYVSSIDIIDCDVIMEKCEVFGISDKLKQDFLESAYSKELFSLAMVLFSTLVPGHYPFPLEWCKDYEVIFPGTKEGISPKSLNELLEKNYSEAIVQTLTKMLAHLPQDRYNTYEALAIWENIK